MTVERDVTGLVKTWLQDGVTVLPDRVLDNVLEQVPSTQQERRYRAWRNPAVSNVLKLAVAAAAVVAVVVGGMNLIQRSGDSVGVPLQSDAPVVVPSAVPSASPVQSPAASSANDIARHNMRASGSDLTFTVEKPEIWSGFSDVPNEPDFAIIRRSTAAPTGMSVYFYAPTTTYSDPCRQVPVDPPVGPTVEDLVEALRAVPNITTTEPVEATLGGLPATYLEMTTDDTLPCIPYQFLIWNDNSTQGEGQIVRTWVLEVDGTRIVASALRYPGAEPEGLAEQQRILDSIQFE